MKDLRTLTQDDGTRSLLITDCVALIDAEVKSKRGLGGIAVKTAYALVKTFKPKMMENTVDALLDDFAEVLQRHYQTFQEEGERGPLQEFFGGRADMVAEELLQVTDVRANRSSHGTIVKAYKKLRPKAKEHVGIAMPNLGKLLDKHAAALAA